MKSKIYLIALFASLMVAPYTTAQVRKKANSKKEIAIQLYSVREKIGSFNTTTDNYSVDYTAILREIAKMGYTGIEAAGYNDGKFYDRTPEVFKKDVEAAGLKVLSSHCTKNLSAEEYASGDFTESLKWWDKCIAAHKAAGMTYIVTPGTGVPKTAKDLKTYCDYSNEIGKRCRQNGMLYGYHNHAHEFQKIEDKVIMIDYMIENTNPEYVFFEMDVYWVVIGRNSPVDYFNKYPGRFTVLHIKDHREIGQSGMVGFDAIFNNAKTAGVKHIIVEMEQSSTTIEEGIKTSIDYLLKAPFVKASYSK
ncbi:MAG: sugar phosphate isomerase/epimerase [Prevotellaceae bacterium]|jgi:sugar phosphate isomerase/epimerase|nr:sugar phosphate isomerase/epimerase [Prevotellaceae bacterium]